MLSSSLAEFRPLIPVGSRIAGLDVGTKTIGIAISDAGKIIASPLETIRRIKFTKDIELLKSLLQKHAIAGLVIGLPVNMDGSEGPRCQSTRQFVKNIEPHLQLPMLLWDERLSTAAVTRPLLDADLSRQRRAEVVDKMAAAFILQGMLDALKHQ